MITQEISEHAKAYLLLTGRLAISGDRRATEGNAPTPLSTQELNKLSADIRQEDADADIVDLMTPRYDRSIPNMQSDHVDRVRALLGRGMKMSLAIEKWQQRGIWVLCREDERYPALFKERLGDKAPPIIYGCGDPGIFDLPGLAVIGSRNADHESLDFARNAGRQAADADFTLISGGAKGVDQSAMTGALNADGFAIAVLSNGLSRAAVTSENRIWIGEDKLLLISPFDPDSGFSVGNAMGRNKLIYALSRAGLVAASDHKKGGTWTGAKEQLDKLKYVPIFVRSTGTPSPGLDGLKELGAKEWPVLDDVEATESLFGMPRNGEEAENSESGSEQLRMSGIGDQPEQSLDDEVSLDGEPTPAEWLLEAIKPALLEVLSEPKDERLIAEELGVAIGQTRAWLKHFVKDGSVTKLTKPIRYVDAGR